MSFSRKSKTPLKGMEISPVTNPTTLYSKFKGQHSTPNDEDKSIESIEQKDLKHLPTV
jgi:hypothetical protein